MLITPHIIKCSFYSEAPNKKSFTDIKKFKTSRGKISLTSITYCFD